MTPKKILITGASGFTGREAVQYFRDQGYSVFGTARKRACDAILKADLTKRDEAFQMIKDVKPDYVLHLAGQNAVKTSWEDPLATIEANLTATLHVLEAIRNYQPGAKTIVVGSALEESLKQVPSHPYGLSKTMQSLVARKWAQLFQLHVVIVKPTNLIGPGFSNGVCASFAQQIAAQEKRNKPCTITISNPGIRRDFLDVRDAVKGYETVLEKGINGEVYEMGMGQSVTLVKVAEIYKEIAEQTVTIDVQQHPSQLDVTPCEPKKMKKMGWKPSFSLKKSLIDCLNFYRDEFNRGKGDALWKG